VREGERVIAKKKERKRERERKREKVTEGNFLAVKK